MEKSSKQGTWGKDVSDVLFEVERDDKNVSPHEANCATPLGGVTPPLLPESVIGVLTKLSVDAGCRSVTIDEDSSDRILCCPKSNCDRKMVNELGALVDRRALYSSTSKMVMHGAWSLEVGWTEEKNKKR
ncbi:hypothetical protein SUGI_0135190 [Cryptomeria japonica]|nr:hypothetical protein SUGI_0135190 [Cryptomeria japonica]